MSAIDQYTTVMTGESAAERDPDTVSLLDLLNVLARRKWLILGTTVFAAVAVLVFLIIARAMPPGTSPLPDVYRSEALVLIDPETTSRTDQLLSSSALGSLLDVGSLGGRSYGQLALELLRSPSLLDRVASRLGLPSEFADSAHPTASARNALTSAAEFTFDQSTGILSVAFEHTDPVFARDAANELMRSLESRFREIGLTQNQTQSAALAVKLEEVESTIGRLEQELKAFQRDNNIVRIQGLAEERTQLMGRLRSDLVLKNVEIGAYEDFAPPNDPVMLRLTNERDSLVRFIQDLESGSPNLNTVMPSQRTIPDLVLEFARLQRDLAVQTEIYTALSGQHELARLSAATERQIFQILEVAEVPEMKAGPSRSMIAMIVTITAFFLAVFLSFVLEYFGAAARDPEESRKLDELRENLRLRRSSR
ncbi:MAG: GumC family protein [Spirochaetota bacterium]